MRVTRRVALKNFSYVAGLSLFLPRGYAQDVLPVRRRVVAAAAGGGAAVAFDSTFEKGLGTSISPFAYASNAGDVTGTVNNNANRFLLAFLVMNHGVATGMAMTWNGVSMTQIGTELNQGNYQINMFGLVAPDTGNQTLSVSWTGIASLDITMGAVSLYNVNQSTPTQNSGSDTGTGTSASSTVTSAADNMAVAGNFNDNASSMSVSAGTEAWQEFDLNGNSGQAYRASTTSSTVITWTLGSSVAWTNFKVDVVKA